MGKSRAEIQKAYRDRQKLKGKTFLEKERVRQRQYYVPAAELSKRKLEIRNSKNKLRNRLCRLRKQDQENESRLSDTSGYETCTTDNDHEYDAAEQNNDPGPSTTPPTRLIVKMPMTGKGARKINARALSRANRTISSLRSEVNELKLKIKTKNKQIERASKKVGVINLNKSQEVTPRRKTLSDLKALHLTPKREKIVRRQLLTSNVIMHEIQEAKKESGSKKVKTIHRIISGKFAKKYRCLKSISHGTGLSRNSLARIVSKNTVIRKEQRKSLSKIVGKSVVDFMNREDNSRTQPGKNDAKKVANQKNKQQTKVLTDYLKNLHNKYTAEYPEHTMSLSTFARLRPTNVLLASFISRNTCQCIHHQNMALKVQSLRKAGLRISENPENLFMHRDELGQLLQAMPETVSYRVWQKVDIGNGKTKMKIVEKLDEKPKFEHDLVQQLGLFEQHVQRVREQYHQVRLLKENLPEDEVMLQMDFAENYSCRSLNEVQTAYWNPTMVTLHPAVAYYKESGKLQHQSYVVVSNEMAHNSSTVCAFIDHLVPELKLLKPNLACVHYWTDSPSSQYRNRFIFHTLLRHKVLYNMKARWNYFEVGHGKGPCDGLGGTMKRMADMAIRQGHVQIQSAEEFYSWGKNSSLNANFIYVSAEETAKKQAEMSSIKAKALKGTMKLHAVGVKEEDETLMTRETSCYCTMCLGGSFCDTWKKEVFRCDADTGATKSRQDAGSVNEPVQKSSTVTEDISNITVSNACNTPSFDEIKVGAQVAAVYENAWFDEIKVGAQVAAVYENAWYIGEVEERDDKDGDFRINFMVKAKQMYKWPSVKDWAWRDLNEILCVVKTLQPSGKSKRLFKISEEERKHIEELFSIQNI